jgi:hypothetical protein
MTLTESERNVLKLCDSKAWQRINRNTFGKELFRLVVNKYLECNGSEYRTTDAGRKVLNATR